MQFQFYKKTQYFFIHLCIRVNFKNGQMKKEINLQISNPAECADLFKELGLELYGHQEKNRVSWKYKNWRFDLDQYPKMPHYLEIEGESEENIVEAIKLLRLEEKIATPKGEREVITDNYHLDWYNMRF